MKTAAIIAAFLITMVVIFVAWTRWKRHEIHSFWDVVRNPGALPDLNQFHREVEETAAELSGHPTVIARLVDRFVFQSMSESDAWGEQRVLAKLGNEAYPRALEILRDRSLKDRLVEETKQENDLPQSPIKRLCKIFDLDAPPPPEAAELLASFFQSDRPEIRKSVALILGSIASKDSLPELRRALRDSDEYVRSYALMGIERAISGGRIEPSTKDEFFALVAGVWPEDTSFSVCDDVPRILLRLDRERAVRHLLDDDLLTVHFEPVWRILEAFNKESVEVPRARLLSIIAEASQNLAQYPMDNVVEEALPLLGAHRNEADLPMLQTMLDHDNEKLSHGATEALYRFHRFADLIRDPWDVAEKQGWDALTSAEKHICAIEQLDGEVNNGGFAQYYFNSSGNNWQDALNGLAAIGAKSRHELMLATINKFGDVKPAADRGLRASQLSKVVRKQEDPFKAQDSAWYKAKDENLVRLIFKYNLANPRGRHKAELPNDAAPE